MEYIFCSKCLNFAQAVLLGNLGYFSNASDFQTFRNKK